jgi:anthranilate synthase component 1
MLLLLLMMLLPPAQVTVLNHKSGSRVVSTESDPMEVPVQLSRNWRPAVVDGVPAVFTGGWVGYAGYDTVRYVYGSECSALDLVL